ncbi:sensor histidine kinase [Prauserella cavernicola]|uniref:histidine kinase n=1 Tax=Prauserella cavernicola TaxID=2800127 RepID=A0A934V752_9PSEU|nr:histidine kinase [Prauserella cavernicola]MBK1788217.1 sensor histidine kinase [Prauserella cavernicola]
MIRRILGPVTSRTTYRRWTYLILGGALSAPYLLFAGVVVPSIVPVSADVGVSLAIGGVAALVVLAGTGLLPPVRALETAAVRELLDDPVPEADPSATGGGARLLAAAMFCCHVLLGALVSLLSLLVPALLGLAVAAPFTGSLGAPGSPFPVPRGWASAWLPAVLLFALVLLFPLVSATGALLVRAATAWLGLPAAERIERLERRAGQLAERNRLARELHDSVGHALSVVSLQAGAARRTLRRDPDTAERALLAIEDSARAALDDLDHVLGLLRDETPGRAPQAGLAELPALLSATRAAGLDVADEVSLDAAVAPVVSREAYRIVQECLTNVLRHAGKVPVTVRVCTADGELALSVRNPAGSADGTAREGGGSGLPGITERVEVLGGRLRAGRDGADWEVAVWLPTGTRGGG